MISLKNSAMHFTAGAVAGTGLALKGYIPLTALGVGAAGAFCVAQNFFGNIIFSQLNYYVVRNFGFSHYQGSIDAVLMTLSHLAAGASMYAYGLLAVKVGLIAAGTLNPVAMAFLIAIGTTLAVSRFSYGYYQYSHSFSRMITVPTYDRRDHHSRLSGF